MPPYMPAQLWTITRLTRVLPLPERLVVSRITSVSGENVKTGPFPSCFVHEKSPHECGGLDWALVDPVLAHELLGECCSFCVVHGAGDELDAGVLDSSAAGRTDTGAKLDAVA